MFGLIDSVRPELRSRIGSPTTTGCWPWLGSCNNKGYAQFWTAGSSRSVARSVWESIAGDLAGKQLRHMCEQRSCVNPAHHEVSTRTRGVPSAPRAAAGVGVDERLPQRFRSKVLRTPDGCWEWQATCCPNGYGSYWSAERRTMVNAHRVAWELLVGTIDDDLVIDHLCRNRRCVNPTHLRPVTTWDNVMAPGSLSPAKSNAAKTTCPQGHPLPAYARGRVRPCRECARRYGQRIPVAHRRALSARSRRRRLERWAELKAAVRERDGDRCTRCGLTLIMGGCGTSALAGFVVRTAGDVAVASADELACACRKCMERDGLVKATAHTRVVV